jgi:hypothetical protein
MIHAGVRWFDALVPPVRVRGDRRLLHYVDGVAETPGDSYAAMATDQDDNSQLVLGKQSKTTDHLWQGEIDEVAIFDRVLTPAEVAAIKGPRRRARDARDPRPRTHGRAR